MKDQDDDSTIPLSGVAQVEVFGIKLCRRKHTLFSIRNSLIWVYAFKLRVAGLFLTYLAGRSTFVVTSNPSRKCIVRELAKTKVTTRGLRFGPSNSTLQSHSADKPPYYQRYKRSKFFGFSNCRKKALLIVCGN